MIMIHGISTSAVIFNTTTQEHSIDDYAVAQLKNLCDNPAFIGCKIRVMPDVHPGKVGTIGFTSTLGKQILPNVIGIDIGCGVTIAKVKGKIRDFQKLDTVIRENVPSGFSIREEMYHSAKDIDLSSLYCFQHINEKKSLLSLGTLGGGNHFIEVDQDKDGDSYLVVHSGSRHLGKEVTEHYLKEGQKIIRQTGANVPYELTYLDNPLMEYYLHDLLLVQKFASLNRKIILQAICKKMKWKMTDSFDCIHNYVDFDSEIPIIRKGAISAKKGEPVIIPIHMKDGIILGHGLGNEEWNSSAPHGAGRILKRQDVKRNYTVTDFKKEMKGIHCTCISKETLDESPFAYRNLTAILDTVKDTITIDKVITPVYNFKAGGN